MTDKRQPWIFQKTSLMNLQWGTLPIVFMNPVCLPAFKNETIRGENMGHQNLFGL